MALSTIDKEKINKMGEDAQKVKLGDAVYRAPVVLKKAITADATGGSAVDIPFAMEVIDAVVICTATNSSGTLILKKGSTAITNAIACATDTNVARAGTIDDSVMVLAAGDTVTVTANGANDRGIMYIHGYRL